MVNISANLILRHKSNNNNSLMCPVSKFHWRYIPPAAATRQAKTCEDSFAQNINSKLKCIPERQGN